MKLNEIKSVNLSEKYLIDYQEASRVIIAGGRDFNDYEYMSTKLNELFKDQNLFNNKAIKVISGMAKGADTLGIQYADEHKLTKILFPANWKEYPRIAGFLRNNDMLSIATHLIAFWNGESSGTKHMIEIAQEKGIPTWILKY